jgi:hypothetical protein
MRDGTPRVVAVHMKLIHDRDRALSAMIEEEDTK